MPGKFEVEAISVNFFYDISEYIKTPSPIQPLNLISNEPNATATPTPPPAHSSHHEPNATADAQRPPSKIFPPHVLCFHSTHPKIFTGLQQNCPDSQTKATAARDFSQRDRDGGAGSRLFLGRRVGFPTHSRHYKDGRRVHSRPRSCTDVRKDLHRILGTHGSRFNSVRPHRGVVHGNSASLLGHSRRHSAESTGQRPRHSVPVGHILGDGSATRAGGRLAGGNVHDFNGTSKHATGDGD